MEKKDKSVVCAMVMGDGHIRPAKPELAISHCDAQVEYLNHKLNILCDLFNKSVSISRVKSRNDTNTFNRFFMTHRYFRVLRKWCYKDGYKQFTRKLLNKFTHHAIAIWYMDDGSLYPKKRNGKVHAYELVISCCVSTEKEVNVIVDYFKEVHDVKFTIKRNKGRFSIRCGTTQARKFIDIVKPFVIPCMQYKVCM